MNLCLTISLCFIPQYLVVLLLLLQSVYCYFSSGQSQLIGPPRPILAIVGDDIILPSHLDPAVDAFGITVEWARPDLKPRFVHVWRDGVNLLINQNPSYIGRTSLFMDKLKNGDVSLKLSKVKLSDEGKYRCFIPSLGRDTIIQEAFIQLNVGESVSRHGLRNCTEQSLYCIVAFMTPITEKSLLLSLLIRCCLLSCHQREQKQQWSGFRV
uniref:Immunoglobulin V-set domain-containing protein n=1 Tax=Myripristis murdjan TaxID=586833 RepID=A0A667YUA2_9TELE